MYNGFFGQWQRNCSSFRIKHCGLTAAKFEWAGMSIHGEILQLHGTLR